VRAQIGDGGVEVVDPDREMIGFWSRLVGLHQVHLLTAGVEPMAGAEVGTGQLGETEDVAVEREAGVGVGNTDGDVMDSGGLHGKQAYAGSVPPAQDATKGTWKTWARSTGWSSR
jgi:hypothetical protein